MAGDVELRALERLVAEVRALENPSTTLDDWEAAAQRMDALAAEVSAQGGHLELEGFERARMKFAAGVR